MVASMHRTLVCVTISCLLLTCSATSTRVVSFPWLPGQEAGYSDADAYSTLSGGSGGYQTPSAVTSSSIRESSLSAHNYYRAKHGVPALVWSETVANSAQTWADKCIFQHSGYGYGENLAWGHQSIEEAIADWYNEIHSYNWYNPGFSMGTGHFTQMVWKTSQHLGCARGNCPNMNLWVCQYDPPGNYMGQFAQNVLPLQ